MGPTTEDTVRREPELDQVIVRPRADSILREFDTPNARTGPKEKFYHSKDGQWRTIYERNDRNEEILIVSISKTGAIWDEQTTVKIVNGRATISYKSEKVFIPDPQNPKVRRPLENTDSAITYAEDQLARAGLVMQPAVPTSPAPPTPLSSQPSLN